MTAAGPSLGSVTHLAINTLLIWHTVAPNMITTTSSLLVPLAKACPLLQTLELDGDIGDEALAAFGASCPNLSRLILTAFSVSFNNLLTVLPNLLHVEVLNSKYVYAMGRSLEGYCQNAARTLSYSKHLQTMVLPEWNIKHASAWSLLPPSLTTIQMGACEASPPPGTMLSAVKEFSVGTPSKPNSNHVNIQQLVGILQAMPHLKHLRCRAVCLFDSDQLSSLRILHDRCLAGIHSPPSIELKMPTSTPLHDDVGVFLSLSAVLSAFSSLKASGRFPNGGLTRLVRVFPNLVCLELFQPKDLTEGAAGLLKTLASLRTLKIVESDTVTRRDARAFMRLPSLRFLHLIKCRLISDAKDLQASARDGLVIEVQPC